MKVCIVPTVAIKCFTLQGCFEFESRLDGDTTRRNVAHGMEQLHSMQTQLIERPLTDCGGRQWCVSFASRLGKHPICDFGGTTYEVDGLECESAESRFIRSLSDCPAGARLLVPGLGPSRNDLLGFSLVKGVWNPSSTSRIGWTNWLIDPGGITGSINRGICQL